MKCTDIDNLIDDYLERALDKKSLSAFHQHVSGCHRCATQLENAQALLDGLSSISVPAPAPGFEQRVFSRVRLQYPEQPRHGSFFRFATGFATASIAGLAILFATYVFLPQSSPIQDEIGAHMIDVSMSQSSTIRLVFEAEQAFNAVNLTIDLPINMEVEGYPGHHQLSWTTNLEKGQNVLALPVIALDPGKGELVAKLDYGDKQKEFRIMLKTGLEGALMERMNQLNAV
jgi:hypothetical protein